MRDLCATPTAAVNFDGAPIEEKYSSWASEDLTDDGLFDMPKWTRERERLDKIWQVRASEHTSSPKLTPPPHLPPTYPTAFLQNLSNKPHTSLLPSPQNLPTL